MKRSLLLHRRREIGKGQFKRSKMLSRSVQLIAKANNALIFARKCSKVSTSPALLAHPKRHFFRLRLGHRSTPERQREELARQRVGPTVSISILTARTPFPWQRHAATSLESGNRTRIHQGTNADARTPECAVRSSFLSLKSQIRCLPNPRTPPQRRKLMLMVFSFTQMMENRPRPILNCSLNTSGDFW